MTSTVYVLGCGPAGLAAAHAACELGIRVEIISNNRKSHMFGAQYLHKPIPGLDPGEARTITYRLQGSIKEYRAKVYGMGTDVEVSPDTLEENHQAWDIRLAYNQLWDRYRNLIRAENVTPSWMMDNAMLRPMISSIPMPSICFGNHVFTHADIFSAGEAPELGVWIPAIQDIPEDTVVCNGLAEPSWYRASRIFGRGTIEWPYLTEHGYGAKVSKPITNSCDCWPNVLRVGRYGKWEKGVLVHHAYEEALEWLKSL